MLERYKSYSREEAHDIIEPTANYTRGARLWGMQGVIPLKDSAVKEYVFL